MLLRYVLIYALLFFVSLPLAGQLKHWNGSNGSWNTPSAWTGGTLPDAGSHVYISCNCSVEVDNNFFARASRVTIQSGSSLVVETGSRLRVETDAITAIHNNGTFVVKGRLYVHGAPTNANGIYNYGRIHFGVGSSNYFYDNQTAISNAGSIFNAGNIYPEYGFSLIRENLISCLNGSRFTNSSTGNIYFEDCTDVALEVFQGASFENSGTLQFADALEQEALKNYGTFSNDGTMRIYQVYGYVGIDGLNNFGEFTNSGELEIIKLGSGVALQNQGGNFTNKEDGQISIEALDGVDIALEFIGSGKRLINRGLVEIATYSDTDGAYFHFSTELRNEATGTFRLTGNSAVGLDLNDAMLRNLGGLVTIEKSGGGGLKLRATSVVFNENCGTFRTERGMEIDNSQFHNRAWMEIGAATNAHFLTNNGVVTNIRLIHDPAGSLQGLPLANGGTVIWPISVPVVIGQPVPNALRKAQNSSVRVSSIWSSNPSGSPVVANYSNNSNVMAANGNAPNGLTTMYAAFLLPNGCGVKVYDIPIPNGVQQPFSAPGAPGVVLLEKVGTTDEFVQLSVYPNPAVEQITVQFPGQFKGEVSIALYSMTGKLVAEQSVDATILRTVVKRPMGLPAGNYVIKVSDQEGNVASQRIIFNR